MASVILTRSGEVVAMTSSSCMIISEPIEFCREIECSGVSSLDCQNPIFQVRIHLHRRAVMRTKELHSFFSDGGEFQ